MKLTFFIVSSPGVESITLGEIKSLGLKRAKLVEGGVLIQGTERDLYSCHYWLRTASKIFLRISEGGVHNFADLTKTFEQIPIAAYADSLTPIEVSAASHASTLYHTGGIERAALDGVVSQGFRPSTDADDPASSTPLKIKVRIVRNWCTVSIDASGDPLYQRGYKQDVGTAPLRETLAAAALIALRWTSEIPLVDPFCGSGTIPIEAALIARHTPPGLMRTFGFQQWPQFNRGAWSSVVGEGASIIGTHSSKSVVIAGSDLNPNMIQQAARNAERAGVLSNLTLAVRDVRDLAAPPAGSLILANPPYGDRLENPQGVADILEQFGKAIRHRAKGSRVAVILPSSAPVGTIGVGLKEELCFLHGGKRVRLLSGQIA